VAAGAADINQCPPGGDAGVARLANLLGREAKALNPANGAYRPPQVAVIDEATCIGAPSASRPARSTRSSAPRN
jgi:electron transport complex protein RnfB